MTVDQLIPLAEIPHLIPPKKGRHISPDTVARWCTVGVRGVKLERLDVAGRWFVTQEMLDTFREKTGR